jgi:hypothetical protein
MKFIINHKGGTFKLDLPPPANRDSFFVLSLHKAGSVLLSKIVDSICKSANIPTINLALEFYNRGFIFNQVDPTYLNVFCKKGYCFHGFRSTPPHFRQFDFRPFKKVLLIRDPRDIVVSYYYSVAKSHGVPDQGEARKRILSQRELANQSSIDEFVLSENIFTDWVYQAYEDFIDTNTKIFRYEDIIFKKRQWVYDICYYLGIVIPHETINKIADENDILPNKEDPDAHIRQVRPGNYRLKLKEETIRKLNERFKPVLGKYYPDLIGAV